MNVVLISLGIFFYGCCSTDTGNLNDRTEIIEIPFVLRNGGIFVKGVERIVFDAIINNKTKGYFSFDTAGSISAVPFRSLFGFRKIQINGPKLEKIYMIDRLTLGGVNINTRSYTTWIKEGHRAFANEDLNGLLGLYIFAGYWCEISFTKQKILLHRQKPDYFSQSVPAKLISGNPAVPVMVDGQKVFCLIDTGAPGTLYLPESIVELKKTDEYTTVVSAGRPWDNEVKNYHLVKTHEITVFDQTFTDTYVTTNSYTAEYSKNPEYNRIGIVGLTFLKNYDLLFDLTGFNPEDISLGVFGLSKIWERDTTDVYIKPRISPEARKYGMDSPFSPKDIPAMGILKATRINGNAIQVTALLEGSSAQTVFGLKLWTVITKLNGRILEELVSEDFTSPGFPDTVVLKMSNQSGSFMWWELGPKELTALGFSDTVKEITVLENGIERVIRNNMELFKSERTENAGTPIYHNNN
jgi:hypothetical protein